MVSFTNSAQVAFARREATGELTYAGNFHKDICVGSVPFGGHLLSVVITAVQQATATTPLTDIIHLTAYFLKAAEVGPCEVQIRFLRSGKAFHNLEANVVQKGETRISSHFLVGRLGEAHLDAATARPLTLTPSQPIYRRTPVGVHPATAKPRDLPAFLQFRQGLRSAPDPTFFARNAHKAASKNDGSSIDQNGVLEFGALLEFTDPADELNAVTIPILADLFRSTPVLVDIAEGRAEASDPAKLSWFPTMVLSLEFKHRIPRGASFSTRTAAIYSQGRFLTEGRHEVVVEIWTAPPGEVGKAGAIVDKDWREKMVCVAVSTQMALTMGGASNTKRGQKGSGVATVPKL